MQSADFLVVGGGIAGASAGYELAKAGRVILLERESQPGYHSTGRSAAHLTETYGNEIIRRLVKVSRRFMEAPPEDFAEHPLVTPRGELVLAAEEGVAELETEFERARRLVPAIHRIDLSDCVGLVPVLRAEAFAAAFYDPTSMDIDVHGLLQGFLRGFKARGGALVTGAEVTALGGAGGIWHCETAAGSFAAPVVVNAAGAWADHLAILAGAEPVGLVPKRRSAFTIEPPDGLAVDRWPLTGDLAETIYFRPDAGRLMVSPADATPVPPQDVQPEELDLAIGADRLQRATSLEVRRMAHSWAGLRTFAADETPVVGPDPLLEGFFWLAGQGGYGVKTSSALARATASLLLENRLPDDLAELGLCVADLAPARFARAG